MAAPAKLISTSIGFQDPKGTVVANGMLMLTLSQTATVTASGGQVTTEPIYLNLDANGKITSTAIWFNDEVSPSGTIYYGVVYAANKIRQIPGLDKLQYSITGASFDIATATQSGPASPSYGLAVMQNPTAQQNINGQTLNMEGASLSFSATASTTADSFFSRLAAGVIGVGTAIGNALGTLRAAILQIGGSDTGLTRDSAGIVDVGNGTQGDLSGGLKGASLVFTTLAMGANGLITQGSIGSVGGISAGGGAGILAIGNGTLGDTSGTLKLTALNHGGTLSLPTSTDTLVGKATTDTLTNKTVTGAGSGNSVTLLNTQAPIAALTGDSTDKTVYSFQIPANTIQAGKGFRIKIVGFHNSGTASVTYKVIIGSTTTATVGTTSGNTGNWTFSMFNNSGVQNTQYYEAQASDGVSANMVNTFGTCAENFANAITVKFTFNVANTDQYTGKYWLVELIQ